MNTFKSKIDKIWVGMLAGAILPVIGFFLSKSVLASGATVGQYWRLMNAPELEINKDILVFSMLPSMFMFWVFYFGMKTDRAAKGLVFITLIVAAFAAFKAF